MLRLDVRFLNSSTDVEVAGGSQVSKMNYYLPHTGTNGLEDVPVVNTITYRNLYAGIDLIAHNEEIPSYEFVAAAGADPKQIIFDWDGATNINLSTNGDLNIVTLAGKITYPAPTAYQMIGGVKVPVTLSYDLNGTSVGFNFGNFNSLYGIVLNVDNKPAPTSPYFYGNVYWGTQIYAMRLYDVKMNSNNEIFAIGYAYSYPFPINTTPGQYQNGFSPVDVIVAKFDANRGVEWGTMLGGTGDDVGNRIAVAPNGAVYCASWTWSDDFVGYAGNLGSNFHATPWQVPSANNDAVLTKLNKFGKMGQFNNLPTTTFSTYFGGNGDNYINALEVDGDNNLYLGGEFRPGSSGNNFSLSTIPLNYSNFGYYVGFTLHGGAFMAKFSGTDFLDWCTALGKGTGNNASVHSIAKDNSNNMYVYGAINTPNVNVSNGYSGPITSFNIANSFPIVKFIAGNYLQGSAGGQDAFVMKFNAATNALAWSTLFGGASSEGAVIGGYPFGGVSAELGGIAVDKNGQIFIAGSTSSLATGTNPFPITNLAGAGVYNNSTNIGGFVARFSNNAALNWCTYYSPVSGISINGGNSLNVCGTIGAVGPGLPLKQRSGTYYQNTAIGIDINGFIAQFGLDGIWQFSTYYGYQDGAVNAITNDATDNHIVSVGSCVIGRNIPNTNTDYFIGLPLNPFDAGISNILQGCVGCQRFGAAEDEIPSDMVISPNPTKQFFRLDNPQKTRIDAVYLYNAAGQVVKSYENLGEVSSQTFDIRTLPTGLYHLQIHSIEGIHNHKLIIE